MAYSDLNPAWDNLQRQDWKARHNDEVSLARAIRAQFPEMSRSNALREAARIIAAKPR